MIVKLEECKFTIDRVKVDIKLLDNFTDCIIFKNEGNEISGLYQINDQRMDFQIPSRLLIQNYRISNSKYFNRYSISMDEGLIIGNSACLILEYLISNFVVSLKFDLSNLISSKKYLKEQIPKLNGPTKLLTLIIIDYIRTFKEIIYEDQIERIRIEFDRKLDFITKSFNKNLEKINHREINLQHQIDELRLLID